MLTAELFTRAKIWKHPKSPAKKDWIMTRWPIYTTEHYAAAKKNAISPFATTRIDLGVTCSVK